MKACHDSLAPHEYEARVITTKSRKYKYKKKKKLRVKKGSKVEETLL
jgi:hypothetical protein